MDLNSQTALLLIDIQKGLDEEEFYGGNRNNRNAESNMAKILERWRQLGWPIFHVRHSSRNPESPLHRTKPGFEIKEEVKPLEHEPLLTKDVNSGFIGTNLQELLQSAGVNQVVIIGLTTNHCVSTTARMASNLEFQTIVISDATAAFDLIGIKGEHYASETIHLTSLASLQEEFAQVVTTEVLLNLI